jgi:hypothetical protein
MSPKQIAIRNVALIIASALAVGLATVLAISYLTLTWFAIGSCVVMVCYGIKMMYDIELNKAKTLAQLNDGK